jgi:hypothetical protein
VGYFNEHQTPIAGGWPGLLVLAPDFGTGEPMPPPPPTEDHQRIALDHAYEAIRVLDEARYRTRAVNNGKAWDDVGSVADYLHDIAEARLPNLACRPGADPAPGPSPSPPPRPVHGFTATHHWDGHPGAADVYAGPRGTPMRLALGGTAEGWGSITPLERPSRRLTYRWDDPSVPDAAAVFVAAASAPLCMEALGLTMYTWVLRAQKQGRPASYALGHVLKDPARFGPVHPWEAVCQLGDSGIETLCPARCGDCAAAHLHVLAWWGHGPLPASGTGDIPAVEALADLGIAIDEWVAAVPSPQHYQQCRAKAGRFV